MDEAKDKGTGIKTGLGAGWQNRVKKSEGERTAMKGSHAQEAKVPLMVTVWPSQRGSAWGSLRFRVSNNRRTHSMCTKEKSRSGAWARGRRWRRWPEGCYQHVTLVSKAVSQEKGAESRADGK